MRYSFQNREEESPRDSSGLSIWNRSFLPYFGSKRKELFYRELALLLGARVPLKDSLSLLKETEHRREGIEFYTSLNVALVRGFSFFEAMQAKKSVSVFEWHALRIGEETGQLARVCTSLGQFYSQRNQFRSSLQTAMAYPALLMVTAILVVVFLLTTLVPMFQGIFSQQGLALPSITRWIIQWAQLISDHFFLLVLGMGVGFWGLRFLFRYPPLKRYYHYGLCRLPWIGRWVSLQYSYQFCQSMQLVTQAQLTLSKSLDLLIAMYAFYPLREALQQVKQDILRGSSLSRSLRKVAFFDAHLHTFVHVGEETHQLEQIFRELTNYYGEKVMHATKRFGSLIEPLVILGVGGLIGFILIAMYVPMFQLSTVFG